MSVSHPIAQSGNGSRSWIGSLAWLRSAQFDSRTGNVSRRSLWVNRDSAWYWADQRIQKPVTSVQDFAREVSKHFHRGSSVEVARLRHLLLEYRQGAWNRNFEDAMYRALDAEVAEKLDLDEDQAKAFHDFLSSGGRTAPPMGESDSGDEEQPAEVLIRAEAYTDSLQDVMSEEGNEHWATILDTTKCFNRYSNAVNQWRLSRQQQSRS